MIIKEKQIKQLKRDTKEKLLEILYIIEDELGYKCKKISNTIDYLQDNE